MKIFKLNKSKHTISIQSLTMLEFETLQVILKTIRTDIVECGKEVKFDDEDVSYCNGSYAYRVNKETRDLIDQLTQKLIL